MRRGHQDHHDLGRDQHPHDVHGQRLQRVQVLRRSGTGPGLCRHRPSLLVRIFEPDHEERVQEDPVHGVHGHHHDGKPDPRHILLPQNAAGWNQF